jgi:hypothetical protein
MKTAHEGAVTWGHHRELVFTGGETARGVGCHNWEVGKERLQHLGLCILTGMTTNLSKFSRENLSIESLLLGFLSRFLSLYGVRVREDGVREKCLGGD